MKILKSQKQIRQNVSRIQAPYDEIFLKTKKLLRHDIAPREKRMEILLDFSELLADASMNKQPPEELFPDGFDSFYAELVSGIPSYSAERRVKKMKNLAVVCGVLVVLTLGILLSYSGILGIWIEGLPSIAGNLNQYDYHLGTISEEYTFTIDLEDLESNAGKIVYHEINEHGEEFTIRIKSVYQDAHFRPYSISFISEGSYNMQGAKLISAVSHYSTSSRYFSKDVVAELYCIDGDIKYDCRVRGIDGLKRTGDSFGYYLPIEVTDKYDSITLTFTNLAVNIWNRK
ncbi:MAG: hypothetical protein J6D19_01155 [Clostridia bacterium]|nr:hypothetical protein [Clostridia bacterium]